MTTQTNTNSQGQGSRPESEPIVATVPTQTPTPEFKTDPKKVDDQRFGGTNFENNGGIIFIH